MLCGFYIGLQYFTKKNEMTNTGEMGKHRNDTKVLKHCMIIIVSTFTVASFEPAVGSS